MAESLTDVVEMLSSYRAQRISIVTKSDNRFEGWLKEIYPDTQSITLNKVRFCGTESRRDLRAGSVQSARMELYSDIQLYLKEAKEIFAHIERSPEMCMDPAVLDSGDAIIPILWATARLPNKKDALILPMPPDQRISKRQTPTSDRNPLLDIPAALRLLTEQMQRTEKPEVCFISAANIRYDGKLRGVDPDRRSVSLTHVRLVGTEDRPAVKIVAPRVERYPSVQFQLHHLQYIRINVAMCQDMFEDTAVMVDESSHGVIEMDARCPLPTAPQSIPQPLTSNTENPIINGPTAARSTTILSKNTAAASPVGGVYLNSMRTSTRSRKSISQPRLVSLATRSRAQSQQLAVVTDGYNVRKRNVSVNPEKGTVHAKRAPRSSILKKVNNNVPSSSQSAAMDSIVGGSGNDDLNGDSVYNLPDETPAATGAVVFDVTMHMRSDVDADTKNLLCPVPRCTHSANNLRTMEFHFNKIHVQQYPKYELRLCCSSCLEVGFDRQVPVLRKHMEKYHGKKDVCPLNTSAVVNGTAPDPASGEEQLPLRLLDESTLDSNSTGSIQG